MESAAGVVASHKVLEPSPPVEQGFFANVPAVYVQEVEGHEHDVLRAPSQCIRKCAEVRSALLILDDRLTVDYGAAALELASRAQDRRVAVGPVEAVSREGANPVFVDYELRPVAVIFDLVNPVAALGHVGR